LEEFGKWHGATAWFQVLQKLLSPQESLKDELAKNNIDEKDLKKSDEIAKKLLKTPLYSKIHREHLLTLSLYTSNLFYREVNKALRQEGPLMEVTEGLTKWHRSIFSFIQGFHQLPCVLETKVYRGMGRPDSEKLKQWCTVDKIVLFEEFTSCSMKESVAISFAANQEEPLLLRIESKSGRNFRDLSHFQSEEVLFHPYTSFRVLSFEDKELDCDVKYQVTEDGKKK